MIFLGTNNDNISLISTHKAFEDQTAEDPCTREIFYTSLLKNATPINGGPRISQTGEGDPLQSANADGINSVFINTRPITNGE